MKPRLTIIAALDHNQLLADAHGIPWKLPNDAAHFRSFTRGQWLLLGRRTFSEMRGWFDSGHTPLVLSSACGRNPEIGRAVISVPQALTMAEAAGAPEVFCCGGAQTYAAALPYATRMVLTIIEQTYPAESGAVYFPKWNPAEWRTLSEFALPKHNPQEPAASVMVMERAP